MSSPPQQLTSSPASVDVESTTLSNPPDPVKPRVLMLTHRMPYPPDRGDRIRSYHMLRFLARHFEVSIACTSDEAVWLQHHQLLSTIAKRVMIQPISTKLSKAKAIKALLTGKTFTEDYYYRQGLADTIIQWHQQAPFDAILTFCTGMIRYARLLTGQGQAGITATGSQSPAATGHDSDDRDSDRRSAKIIHVMDLVDVDSVKWDSFAHHSWQPMRWVYATEAARLRQIEAGRYDHFDAVTVVSEAEAQAYRDFVGGHPRLVALGNGVDLEYFSPLVDSPSKTLVFVGVLNYAPNIEAVMWFVHEVLGRLREQVPQAKFQIIGRHPTPRVEALEDFPGVEVVGSVPDVRAYLSEASVVVAPLQTARGIQNKVLEAMACGRPVVCSTAAAEGIEATDGLHLVIADSPQQWVQRIEELFATPSLRIQIGQAARQHVERQYSWEERLKPLIGLLGGTTGM